MTTTAVEVGGLLADAHLLAAYAARTGILPDDAILVAIRNIEDKASVSDVTPQEITNLIAAINRISKAIAPVTILDLGSRWRPFPRRRTDIIARPLLAVTAVLLIFLIGSFTYLYTEARGVAQALREVQSQDIFTKAEHFFEHAAFGTDPSSSEPSSEIFAANADYLDEYNNIKNFRKEYTDLQVMLINLMINRCVQYFVLLEAAHQDAHKKL